LSALPVLPARNRIPPQFPRDGTVAAPSPFVSPPASSRYEVKINVVPESPIKLNYFVIESKLCFKTNELLIEFEVPAESTYEEVEQLFAIAIRDMRTRADEKNLLPDIDSGSVGSLNYDEIKRIIAKITRSDKNYAVQFRSGEDVYTMGNLSKVQVKYWVN